MTITGWWWWGSMRNKGRRVRCVLQYVYTFDFSHGFKEFRFLSWPPQEKQNNRWCWENNKKKIYKKSNQVRRGCICIAAGAKHSRRHSAIDARRMQSAATAAFQPTTIRFVKRKVFLPLQLRLYTHSSAWEKNKWWPQVMSIYLNIFRTRKRIGQPQHNRLISDAHSIKVQYDDHSTRFKKNQIQNILFLS